MCAGQPHLVMSIVLSVVGTMSCQTSNSEPARRIPVDANLRADLQLVAQARIFFEHHSVGDNILAGVRQFGAAARIPLRIVALSDAPVPPGPILLHAYGGTNQDPRSKLDAFALALRQRPDIQPELALVKLCYVDFTPTTHVIRIFAYYAHTLAALHHELPGVTLVPVTVPLRVRPHGLRAGLQRLLGRPVWEDEANLRRSEFNQLIREHTVPGSIFDVARAEATHVDGSRVRFVTHGEMGEAMDPRLSSDGGHLNALGQRVVAAAFVHRLAHILRRRTVLLTPRPRTPARPRSSLAGSPDPAHP